MAQLNIIVVSGSGMSGKNGTDLYIKVPVGTFVSKRTDVLDDMDYEEPEDVEEEEEEMDEDLQVSDE